MVRYNRNDRGSNVLMRVYCTYDDFIQRTSYDDNCAFCHFPDRCFSPEIEAVVKETRKNPKRAQRDAKKQTLETGIGTKSQQALKLQQEQNKQERKAISREQREAENRRAFELKQIKKREKHKGH